MEFLVYRVATANGTQGYVLRTGIKGDEYFYVPDPSALAKVARGLMWKFRDKNKKEELQVHCTPPADFELFTQSETPDRCSPLTAYDREIFWPIFSRSEEEAEKLSRASTS